MKNRTWYLKKPKKVYLVEEEVPNIKEDELLVDVEVCGICMLEFYVYNGVITDLNPRPYPLGHEAVGKVIKVGSSVRYCKVGDRVGIIKGYGFSEKLVCNEKEVAKVPVEGDPAIYISEPCACVIQFLKNFHFQPGQNVVIYGLGYMGLLILQCLPVRYFSKVITVEPREDIHILAKEFGADLCINPQKEDQVKIILNECREGVDIVIDACGGIKSVFEQTPQLFRYGNFGGQWGVFSSLFKPIKIEVNIGEITSKGVKYVNSATTDRLEDNKTAAKLLTKGTFNQRKLITHRFSFDEVPKALEVKNSLPKDWIKGVILST